jgi:hypothetical protein
MTTQQRSRPAPGVARRTIRRFRRPLVLFCALVFFFAPWAARIGGQKAVAFENHALASFPSLSSWKFFGSFDTWSVDHLPLRQYAVRGNANLSQAVFGQPPKYGGNADSGLPVVGTKNGPPTQPNQDSSTYSTVIQGKDGWLFFGGDASGACKPKRPLAQELDLLDKLGRAVEASGRQFVFTVAPDKTTMYPDKLPSSFYGKDCMNKQKEQFWSQVTAHPTAGYLDLRGPLAAQQKADGVPIYRKTDTHWGPRGAAVFARALADRLQPSLWSGTQVVPDGTISEHGDLGGLSGVPSTDRTPNWKMVRPGVVLGYHTAPHPLPTPDTVVNRSTSGGSPLYGRKTLLLGDSFTDASREDLLPLFKNVTLLHNTSSLGHPKELTQSFVDNKVIVLEVVERSVVGGGIGLLGPSHLPSILAALAAHPLRH